MRQFRVPEIALGALLAVAIFAMGTTVQIINPKNYTSEAQPSKNTAPVVAEETEAQTNRRIADYNRTLDFLTFFLVLANVALWLVTWRSSVRQSRDMRAALGHAEDTAELQLRAYVFPDNINLVQRTDPLTQKTDGSFRSRGKTREVPEPENSSLKSATSFLY